MTLYARTLSASLLAIGLLLSPSHAQSADGMSSDDLLVPVNIDCRRAAERAAQETGGRVLSARPSGSAACEVTLLVPNEGGRPRRVVVTVPA